MRPRLSMAITLASSSMPSGKLLVQIRAAGNAELYRGDETANGALAGNRGSQLQEHAVAFDLRHGAPDLGAHRDRAPTTRRRDRPTGWASGSSEAGGRTRTGSRRTAPVRPPISTTRAVMRDPTLTRELAALVGEVFGLDETFLFAVELDEDGVATNLHDDDVELFPDVETSGGAGCSSGVAFEERGKGLPFGFLRHRHTLSTTSVRLAGAAIWRAEQC